MDTLNLHAQRGKSVIFAVLALAAAAGLGWFTYVLADPNFSAGASRRAAFLEGWPVELRIGVFGLVALVCLYGAYLMLRSAARIGPIVAIRPDGVADLRRSPEKFIAWSEMEGLTVDQNFLILKRAGRGGVSLNVGGMGKDRIAIPLQHVTTARDEILAVVAARAPHLVRWR